MYTVGVRDFVLVAHSLPRPIFGPAQGVHGSTFHVDVEFQRADVDEDGIVVDIGEARRVLGEILGGINYQNLDDLEIFEGQVTTTEFLCKWDHDQMKGQMGFDGRIEVTLHESHVAWARYAGD